MNQRRRCSSTLLCGAIAVSAVACSAPVQQAPKLAAAPVQSVAPPPPTRVDPAPSVASAPVAAPAPDLAASTEPSVSEIVARVQAVYDKSNAVKLGFKQRYAYGTPKDSTGSVIAEKPSQMSWRYGNGNRVVVGGGTVQVYEKANNQLFVVPVSKSQFPLALSFTFGQGRLERDFRFTKQDAQRMKFPSGYVVSGEPLKPTSAFQRAYFYVDGKSYVVRRVVLVDAQGNRNRFDFVKTELGVRVPPNEFHLAVPPGTRIIEYEGGRPGERGQLPAVAVIVALSRLSNTPADPGFWLRFRCGPVLTYSSTLRSGPRESLARNQAWRAVS